MPQGSVLGPLLFLICINDLVGEIHTCRINLFADDSCIYYSYKNRENGAKLINADLDRITEWSEKWLVDFNACKTESLLISNKKNKQRNPNLFMNDNIITEVKCHKHLGITLTSDLSWKTHIEEVCNKAKKACIKNAEI